MEMVDEDTDEDDMDDEDMDEDDTYVIEEKVEEEEEAEEEVAPQPTNRKLNLSGDADGYPLTLSLEITPDNRVSGTFNDRVRLSGKEQIDSVSWLKVNISLTRVEDKFSGQVTFDRAGQTYTRQAILYRY